MSRERSNGVPKRRPPSVTSLSPNVNGKDKALSGTACSPMSNGIIAQSKDSRYEGAKVAHSSPRDEVATPVGHFLSSNITPRSGSRKARAETASPTYNFTPTREPYVSRSTTPYSEAGRGTGNARPHSELGLGITNATSGSRARTVLSDGPGSLVSSNRNSSTADDVVSTESDPENVPKFFHANEIKATLPSRPTSERLLPQIPSPEHTQFTNGTVANDRGSLLGRTPTPDELRPKFFYANNRNDTKTPPAKAINSNNASRPQLQTIYSANMATSPPRASSPLKEEVLPRKPSLSKPSPRRHTRLVSNGGSEIKSPPYAAEKVDLARRSSMSTSRGTRTSTHVRSPSVPTTAPSQSRRSSLTMSDGSPVKRARTTSLNANGDFPHSVNPPSITNELPGSPIASRPMSPVKQAATGQSKIDQMNELAANARRERKVLDLEISNSSLLAINRTLEREMRKQSAELRRFRRLSRSGRMSIAPSSRSVSGRMSSLSEADAVTDSDDLVSSSSEEDDATDLHSNISSNSTASHPLSFTSRAARTRFKDPRKVELDLAGHRVLLADFQKLNISIKRCLAHSELLISSGKRALEYHVQVTKFDKPSARVLTPEYVEEDFVEHGQGLLSPGLPVNSINPWERALSDVSYGGDGLETPDYSKWGPPTAAQTPFADDKEPASVGNNEESKLGGATESDNVATPNGSEVSSEFDHQQRRVSNIASIDGLDDDSDSLSPEEGDRKSPSTVEMKQIISELAKIPSRMSSPERKAQDLEPQLGQPGYRGSMQGLGHYLQAFSIFGVSQQK